MTNTRNSAAAISLMLGALSAQAVPVPGQGTWETTLQARDINGDGQTDAFYDTVLDITWLADANAADVRMGWNDANAWAAGLDVHGIGGWRLPATFDIGGDGCNYSEGGTDCGFKPVPASSEMAHLYYVTLGNIGALDPGWGFSNTANFSNIVTSFYSYWSGTPNAAVAGAAWYFYPEYGVQGTAGIATEYHAWAVRDGDVPVVPEPGTWALMLGGLAAVTVACQRRRLSPTLGA